MKNTGSGQYMVSMCHFNFASTWSVMSFKYWPETTSGSLLGSATDKVQILTLLSLNILSLFTLKIFQKVKMSEKCRNNKNSDNPLTFVVPKEVNMKQVSVKLFAGSPKETRLQPFEETDWGCCQHEFVYFCTFNADSCNWPAICHNLKKNRQCPVKRPGKCQNLKTSESKSTGTLRLWHFSGSYISDMFSFWRPKHTHTHAHHISVAWRSYYQFSEVIVSVANFFAVFFQSETFCWSRSFYVTER